MKIKTKAFGEIEVSEKQKIHFVKGILGFEDINYYYLLNNDDTSPFYWLQAENIPEIAFVIIDPIYVVSDYKLDIPSKELEDIEIKSKEEILLFSIVTIYEKAEDITVNLLGPIVINKLNKKGKQVINQDDSYKIKHPLIKRGNE